MRRIAYATSLFAAGAAAAVGIAVAPVASAAYTAQSCTDVGGSATQCQTPGNVQINDAPPAVDTGPTYPYWGNSYGPMFV